MQIGRYVGKSNQNHFVDVMFSVKKRLSMQAEDVTELEEKVDDVDSPDGGAPAKKLKTSDKKQKGKGARGKIGGKKPKPAAAATKPAAKPAKKTNKRPAKKSSGKE